MLTSKHIFRVLNLDLNLYLYTMNMNLNANKDKLNKDESEIDNALRPRKILEFKGQPQIIENLEIFIKGLQKESPFVAFNKEDGSWISPVKSEREWQESILKELFPSYPHGAPRWQYLNGLLHIALEYKEGLETDENEEDENG